MSATCARLLVSVEDVGFRVFGWLSLTFTEGRALMFMCLYPDHENPSGGILCLFLGFAHRFGSGTFSGDSSIGY